MSVLRWIRARRERGQTLIIVAVAMVGLLALAGLAIDGGNLFLKRRGAQNAADAAALAGTRLIAMAMMTCDTIDYSGLDLEIARAVNEYAEGNGISDTDGTPGNPVNDNVTAYYVNSAETRLRSDQPVGSGAPVPTDTSGVEVEVRDQHRTYFLIVVGIRNIPSRAEAMAMAGVLRQLPAGSQLLPIGVPQVVVEAIEDEGGNSDWAMHDTGDNLFCYTDSYGEKVCPIDPDAPHEAQRGWLNLNHNFNVLYEEAMDPENRTFEQMPAVESAKCEWPLPGLKGYCSGCSYPKVIYAGTSCYYDGPDGPCGVGWDYMDGDFIHGSAGSSSAGMLAIHNNLVGKVGWAPVFDRVFTKAELEPWFDEGAASPTNWPEPDYSWPTGGGFAPAGGGEGGSWYYHIVGWVAATINPPGPGSDKTKILRGEFLEMSIGAGPIEVVSLDGPCSLLAHGVTLWR